MIETGIPFDVWEHQDVDVILTALDMLKLKREKGGERG